MRKRVYVYVLDWTVMMQRGTWLDLCLNIYVFMRSNYEKRHEVSQDRFVQSADPAQLVYRSMCSGGINVGAGRNQVPYTAPKNLVGKTPGLSWETQTEGVSVAVFHRVSLT